MESLVVVVRLQQASPAQDTSSSSASSGETTSDEAERTVAVSGKRKSSYHMQREEIARLQREAEELESKLQEVRSRQPESLARQDMALRHQVATNRLVIAGAQSLLGNAGSIGEKSPIGSYTHLPIDQLDRERIIKAIKPKQIEDATLYMLARCEYANLDRPSRQVEHFSTTEGDQVAVLWEIAHVTEGKPTAREVFDEMLQSRIGARRTHGEARNTRKRQHR